MIAIQYSCIHSVTIVTMITDNTQTCVQTKVHTGQATNYYYYYYIPTTTIPHLLDVFRLVGVSNWYLFTVVLQLVFTHFAKPIVLYFERAVNDIINIILSITYTSTL